MKIVLMQPLLSCLILIVSGFLFPFSSLYAHSPESIHLKYNPGGKILNVKVDHKVDHLNKHFIKELEIRVNDTEIFNKKFDKQVLKDFQSAQFHMPELKSGDKVIVKASCSILGSKESIIIIK